MEELPLLEVVVVALATQLLLTAVKRDIVPMEIAVLLARLVKDVQPAPLTEDIGVVQLVLNV